ncbi:response regulator [Methylomonas sp. LL1]|uniref:response regulator n=1 Tax=Methylomonas sp. LL1 TaxID=2785785 RepID=UPI0018C3E45B|nr:response regulator [Methylomonas sp. LL1]QPK64433.1 response regulator [Methylomonas sp. LL1]
MSQRSQSRFPCVGIDLMFSPLQDDYIEGMGAKIYQAVCHDMSFSGLSFDVVHAMQVGEQIIIIIENQFQPSERLQAEVRWCKTISEGVFRIGVKILLEQIHDGSPIASADLLEDIAAHPLAMPSGAELRCPACLERAVFELVDNQLGYWMDGVLPLYTCSVCATTRTIPNILEFNRRFYLTELNSNRLVFGANTKLSRPNTLHKILYVEDDPDIQTVAKMAMEMIGGFELEVCDDGYQAQQKAQAFQPDLFLLDMMLPGMTGIQTLEQLRALPGLEQVPAIFMTAKIQNHEIEDYKRQGVLGVIPKPFDPMTLTNDINNIWQGQ